MRKNITISSFKNLPRGFLVAFALFLLTEAFLYANRAELVRDYWNKFLINEHKLIELDRDYDYLIMGDSVQKTGINPHLVSSEILNLGLPGAKPMGQFLMLKRYLERHKPPKAVFLYVDPEDPRDSIFVILRYFISVQEFAFIWSDLTWEERRRFIMRYWVSLDERKVGLTKRFKYKERNEVFVTDMIANQGYMPSPAADETLSDDYFLRHKERYQSKVWVSKRDMKYVNKFMELASANNIKVVYFGFLVPKQLYNILGKTGFNADYLYFFRVLEKLYPHAHFVDNPILYLENKYFGDMSHVNQYGSKIYTEYFRKLFDQLKAKGII